MCTHTSLGLKDLPCILLQAVSKLASASTVAAVTAAQINLETLSKEDGYCPYSQPLLALRAHALLRLQR